MSRLRPLALVVALAIPALSSDAAAQVMQSNIGVVTINAAKVASLTVSITAGAAQNATLVDNSIVTFATPVSIQTSWDVNPGQTASVTLLGSFSNPAQALANGTDYITSSLIEGQVASGTPTTFTAFTGAQVGGIGTAGASLTLFSEAITGANKSKTRNDDLNLRINLTGQTVTAGTYTGTLNIQAVTQ